MNRYNGKSASKGIVTGRINILKKKTATIMRTKIEDAYKENMRVEEALRCAKEQLRNLYNKALLEVGESGAAIFEVHEMMLEDEDFLDAISNTITTEMVNAEYAVAVTSDNFARMFHEMEDEYMKARAADVRDVAERIIRNLNGDIDETDNSSEKVIIVAHDLTPGETVQMNKDKILAFVTTKGSTNSHTAILARMMNIPALVQTEVDMDVLRNGMLAIVDGNDGEFIVEPDESVLAEAENKIVLEKEKTELLEQLKGKENVTKDGRKINIYANVSGVNDLAYVLENDAGGVGLFRSEFLYLGRDDFPTESEQYQVYKQTAQMMADKKVIIRTMDIGADKQVDYMGIEEEENPALGYRAIRICLKQKEIFKTQLRAIFRAAVYGNISIMYPMITSVWEVQAVNKIVGQVQRELSEQGVRYRIPEQGVMIETPAAVMISDKLAGYVDFFSIGTNDLTQYTLAIDRQNEKLEEFYNPHHEAVIKMIEIVVKNAHKYGKWAGICGELGADVSLTETFINMGVDELSVAPGEVLKVRKAVRDIP